MQRNTEMDSDRCMYVIDDAWSTACLDDPLALLAKNEAHGAHQNVGTLADNGVLRSHIRQLELMENFDALSELLAMILPHSGSVLVAADDIVELDED